MLYSYAVYATATPSARNAFAFAAISPLRLPFTALPPCRGSLVHANAPRRLRLYDPERRLMPHQPLAPCLFFRQRVVARGIG